MPGGHHDLSVRTPTTRAGGPSSPLTGLSAQSSSGRTRTTSAGLAAARCCRIAGRSSRTVEQPAPLLDILGTDGRRYTEVGTDGRRHGATPDRWTPIRGNLGPMSGDTP